MMCVSGSAMSGMIVFRVLEEISSGPELAFGFRVLFMFMRSAVVIWEKLNSGKDFLGRYVEWEWFVSILCASLGPISLKYLLNSFAMMLWFPSSEPSMSKVSLRSSLLFFLFAVSNMISQVCLESVVLVSFVW